MVVLLPKTEPCPNPEFWPNAGVVLCPNSPEPVLLAVFALLVPNEKELTLLAVEAPKRFPPVVALLDVAPNVDWPKEKPLDVPLVGWPKPLTWPNTGFPKVAPADAPKAVEPNPVETGAEGADRDEGAEEAGGGGAGGAGDAEGCPNTVLEGVAIVLFTTTGVVVVAAGATVLITGVTPRELLSVVAG